MEVLKTTSDDLEANRLKAVGSAALACMAEFLAGEVTADQALAFLALSVGHNGFATMRGDDDKQS